ncbi:MAG TPA: hypothetical protein VN193_14350 [Candidatus Angelobacter sp.]|nr:hypothetical protein [Candidatus Angelobacter sp.]
MTLPGAVELAIGAALIAAALYDLFQSVVLPRPAVGRVRISPTVLRLAWRAWRAVAIRPRRLQLREGALATFAPLAVIGLLLLWGFSLILGYGLLYHVLGDQLQPRPDGFGTTIFYSTGQMLSFSVDGIDAHGTAVRLLTAMEAATGFALFALVISLLFSLFSAFQRRESAVVALDALAGAPPSGVQLLENCAKHHMPDQLVATFAEWRSWTVDVLESHLSYPLLFYFRSSHDNEAWSNSFGAVMDAASLVICAVEGGPEGPAHLMNKVGDHLVTDIGRYYRVDAEPYSAVEREEFVEACRRLRDAGYAVRDGEEPWHRFAQLRSGYAPSVDRLSRVLALPPAPWIGDRSYLPHRAVRRRPRRAK